LSTIDEFQKRISKLETEVAELKKVVEEIRTTAPKPTLPEAADYEEAKPSAEERIAEEAVEETAIEEKPEEETSEEP